MQLVPLGGSLCLRVDECDVGKKQSSVSSYCTLTVDLNSGFRGALLCNFPGI